MGIVLACIALAGPHTVAGQNIASIDGNQMSVVMPDADRFGEPTADPAVVPAYAVSANGTENLIGYVFLTSDHPPEQVGYNAPIEALVGLRLDGTLSGVRVVRYVESYRAQMGDFLRRGGFQQQYAGKFIGDPFRVWGDVDGISRVTISVRALSRGVRDSARRVYATLIAGADAPGAGSDSGVVGRSWFELGQMGVLERLELEDPGQGSAAISLAYIDSDPTGEYFLGRRLYERATRTMRMREQSRYLLVYAVEGPRLRLFVPDGWSIEQDGDTTEIDPDDIISLALQPSEGVVATEASMVGVMMIERALDLRRPFRVLYDLGSRLGTHVIEYTVGDARAAERVAERADERTDARVDERVDAPAVIAEELTDAAERGAATDASTDTSSPAPRDAISATTEPAETRVPPAPTEPSPSEMAVEPDATADSTVAVPSAAPSLDSEADVPEVPTDSDGAVSDGTGSEIGQLPELDFAVSSDETLLERTLAETSWSRVGRMLLVLTLALWAFFAKTRATRWTSLGATLVILGFWDGSFLSVSHVTSGIWTGMNAYLRDLPLLIMVVFTVVTTLIWGRVFCGFLCPFGALQDVIDRVVPQRFQRTLPARAHDRALYVKYGILAVIVVPALVGSQASSYQYFEPFGTVFFLSPSVFLWTIALLFLVASAVIPRFYCRYACPLGAALAIGSLVSLRRIPRVEQCDHCKVCERACPTGAIRGPRVDFKECVRCNDCEILLREKAGVCRHDMDEIRPRLIQLRVGAASGGMDHE